MPDPVARPEVERLLANSADLEHGKGERAEWIAALHYLLVVEERLRAAEAALREHHKLRDHSSQCGICGRDALAPGPA